jgi:hypothetical protein
MTLLSQKFKPAIEQQVKQSPQPEVQLVKIPVAEHLEQVVETAQEKHVEKNYEVIDLNDLDVPTFMRQQKEVEKHE